MKPTAKALSRAPTETRECHCVLMTGKCWYDDDGECGRYVGDFVLNMKQGNGKMLCASHPPRDRGAAGLGR